jgi:uroporphyrinogen decarboxylase
MNGLERIQATLAAEAVDHVPVIAQVFAHAGVIAGVEVGQYVCDGGLAARCQIEAQRSYGYDAVFAFLDAGVEAEAAGSVLAYHRDLYPHLAQPAIGSPDDIARLSVPDPGSAGRMPELLHAAGALRAEVGDEVLVAGVVLGPMALALQLMGAEQALYLAADDPVRFDELLSFATEVALRFGRAQLEAGVHLPLLFDPGASPAVVPPAFYREFILPRHAEILGGFKAAGAAANWLHISGPVEPILGFYEEAGAEIANLDYQVDALCACEALPHMVFDGNLKPFAFVSGSPEEIVSESRRLLALFEGRGRFILSSGCEIPPEARPENVAALVSAATVRA